MKRLKEYYKRQIEKMGKKQKTTFYTATVILSILIILSIVSLSYAFFTSIITGNETASSDVVETGSLSIVYTNGQELKGESIEPGWSLSKTFTVENTGTVEATYNINWENLTNTFVNKTDLVMSLTSTNGGGTLEESQIRGSGSHINIIKDIKIDPGVIQEYTLTIEYKNKDYDQSSDMGKSLIGKIEVRDAKEVLNEEYIATDYIIGKYSEDNTEGLIKLNQPATEQTPALVEYRYSGSNDVVKNYVNFNNETWRIIGVFPTDDGTGNIENRVKIIREESIGNYSWDSSPAGVNDYLETNILGAGVNQWGESGTYEGADLMRLLNPEYESENINNSLYWNRESGTCYYGNNNQTTSCDFSDSGLTEETKNMIRDAKWYLGAVDQRGITTLDAFVQERGKKIGIADIGISITKTTSWIGKVGLMYPSDYGYASRECYENEKLYQADKNDYRQEICVRTNWMYNNNFQWTLSSYVGAISNVIHVHNHGNLGYIAAFRTYYLTRPVTYLTSDVKIVGGDGTIENMYQLSL